MTDTDDLLAETDGGVLTLTMNRPDALNALTSAMMASLLARLRAAESDPAIGCIVLTGAGRAFSAGGDVRVQAEGGRDADLSVEQRTHALRSRMEASRLLHEMAKPTIAMLNGVAAGAGMALALACDLRVAGESARMTTAFARVGLSGDFGGTWFLTRLVGPARARELYLLSSMLDAAALDRLGLVNRLVADDALRAETMALAHALADGPRVALGLMKHNLKTAEERPLADLLDTEARNMMRAFATEDHREAARAFVEKRPAVFRGR